MSRHPRAAVILAVLLGISGRPAPSPGADAPCIEPIPEDILGRLVLEAPAGAQPGSQVGFTLGTWECCVFVVPYPACAAWTVEPAGAAEVTITEDGTIHQWPGSTGYLDVSPGVPAGTVIRLSADIEAGRAARSAEIHVYTPETNPLAGYWTEESQVTCGGFLRGDPDGIGIVDLSNAVGLFQWLFMGREAPPCPEAADANGDGDVDVSDPIHLLGFLFLGGPPPPGAFPECEPLSTATYLGCPMGSSRCPVELIQPDEPILELLFEADGTFSVTWTPFEVYRDYWGTYSFDLAAGTIALRVEGGNNIPPDLPLGPDSTMTGAFRIDVGVLALDGLWLGSRMDSEATPACGHRFKKPW